MGGNGGPRRKQGDGPHRVRPLFTRAAGLTGACLFCAGFLVLSSPLGIYRYPAGESASAAFSYVSRSSVDYFTGSAAGGASETVTGAAAYDVECSLGGSLVSTVVESDWRGALIGCSAELSDASLTVNGTPDTESIEGIRGTLRGPFFVKADHRGRVSGFAMQGSAPTPFMRNMVAAILSSCEFEVPGMAAWLAGGWEMDQSDPSGGYHAAYHVLENRPGFMEILKVKTAYADKADLTARLGVQFPTILTTNRYTGTLRRGRLGSVFGEEVQELYQGKKQVGVTTLTFTLERGLAARASDAALAVLRGASSSAGTGWLRLFEPPTEQEVYQPLYKQTLAGRNLDNVLKDMQESEARFASDASLDTRPLQAELDAIIYLDPAASGALAERVQRAGSASLAFRLVPQSLSRIGHAEAQTALRGLVAHWRDAPQVCAALLPALGMLRNPVPESEACVLALMDDGNSQVAETAGLNYALMGGSLAYWNAGRSAAIVEELRRRLAAGATERERGYWLMALGNARAESTLALVMPYLDDGSPEVRRGAVYAVRALRSGQVDAPLRSLLRRDPSASVRLAAANALAQREQTPELCALFCERLSAESTAAVRIRLLDNLYTIAGDFPDAAAAIMRAARDDPEEDVRVYAARFAERLALMGQ